MVVGDLAAAEAIYGWSRRTRSTVVRVGPFAGWLGPVDHHLACLAQLFGRSEEAETRLRHALQTERAMNARPFSARTLAHLAVVLAERSRPEADRAAGEAIVAGEELAAPGNVAQVQTTQASASLAG